MRSLLVLVVPPLIAVGVFWITFAVIVRRRRSREAAPDVSPRWLTENRYRKNGDRR